MNGHKMRELKRTTRLISVSALTLLPWMQARRLRIVMFPRCREVHVRAGKPYSLLGSEAQSLFVALCIGLRLAIRFCFC